MAKQTVSCVCVLRFSKGSKTMLLKAKNNVSFFFFACNLIIISYTLYATLGSLLWVATLTVFLFDLKMNLFSYLLITFLF